ncbi:MAG: tetratricopeptide repeat protein [Myxococcales bacterium]|nr:tetratricopeptide repeat protein [Myxococcales bacterium]
MALWEGLYGVRPFAGRTPAELGANVLRAAIVAPPPSRVPAWVRRVLERGLMVEASRRWPGMDALLAALDRDPERTRRRWLAASAGVLAIAAAGYTAAAMRGAESAVCEGAAEEIAGAWGPESRAAVDQAVRATGVAYAERVADTSTQLLDEFAARWTAVHTEACVSHRRGHTSPQLFDRRMACLRQRRSELAATAGVLAQTTRETVAQAAEAARGLPPVALCEDDERLLAAVDPPADPAAAGAVEEMRGRLARVQALERGGRFVEAWHVVAPMVAEAEALDYLPLRAEVELLVGTLQMQRTQMTQAREHLDRALRLGLEARVDEVAAEALVIAMFVVVAGERKGAEALERAELAWALVRRLGSPPLLTARLYNCQGVAYIELGDVDAGVKSYRQALALLEAHAPDDLLRWATANNLAVALEDSGQPAQAKEIAESTYALLVKQYDRCHPHAVSLQIAIAGAEARLGEMSRSVAGYEATLVCLGDEYPLYEVIARRELGAFHLLWGDVEAAKRQIVAAEQVVARTPDARAHGFEVSLLRVDVAFSEGRLADARATLEALVGPLRADERADALAAVETRLGLAALLAGDAAAADEHLKAAAGYGAAQVASLHGLYAFTLARTLHTLGRGERVAALLDEASSAYARQGAPYAGKVAEIQAWRRGIEEK